MAIIRSSEYAWSDLSVVFGGRIIEGIVDVEYVEKREKDKLYGRGAKPHKMLRGNYDYEGKITLWQSELEAMTRDAPGKDVLKLNFDIVFAYVPHDGGQVVTDILTSVELTEVKKALKQGDKNMLVELPIVFLDVKRQQ